MAMMIRDSYLAWISVNSKIRKRKNHVKITFFNLNFAHSMSILPVTTPKKFIM